MLDEDGSDIVPRLEAIAKSICIERGGVLSADPNDDRIVYLASGDAKLMASLSAETHRESHVIAFHFAGDMVSVLRENGNGIRLSALSNLELLVFSTSAFVEAARYTPAVVRSVLGQCLQALERSRTKVMHLSHKSARERLAGFLVSMAERLRGQTCGPCEITLPMGRADIGDNLGLTIETVSRQFSELRNEGLITTTGRSMVQISDVARLVACAGGTEKTARCSED